ncbi:transposase [Bacillus cihuensis]|uniref:transposase n=1 Tax=Bacillus cihuensis TaxID=1208599 RepID=UPI00126923DE
MHAQRIVEVESAFRHIKGNRSFRRFSLWGLDKVHVEFGIIALAHNIQKQVEKNDCFFSTCFIFRTYRTAPSLAIKGVFTSRNRLELSCSSSTINNELCPSCERRFIRCKEYNCMCNFFGIAHSS